MTADVAARSLNSPPDEAPHLLVVDDDMRIRTLLTRFLGSHGFRVTAAASAEEARRQLAAMTFDLLVVDVMMPGESGLEFTQSLRQTSAVPILMLTARAEIPHRIRGLEAAHRRLPSMGSTRPAPTKASRSRLSNRM